LESIHRVQYVSAIRARNLSKKSADPKNNLFDPLKAAIIHQREGHIDEAFWLVFLFVHFGKHAKAGWRYVREVYGRLGDPTRWDWSNTSSDPNAFRKWLHDHQTELKREGVIGGFGNHRKYESLDAYSPHGTGAVVESYVRWIGPQGNHQNLIDHARNVAGGDPQKTFDYLYQSMKTVARFGRTARFDYMSMLGKLSLARIEAGSAYLQDSTGPLRGARLLFGSGTSVMFSAADLDLFLIELNAELKVGMQVLEDALCNWQKSPRELRRFRG
jgi:hypothetical protein